MIHEQDPSLLLLIIEQKCLLSWQEQECYFELVLPYRWDVAKSCNVNLSHCLRILLMNIIYLVINCTQTADQDLKTIYNTGCAQE